MSIKRPEDRHPKTKRASKQQCPCPSTTLLDVHGRSRQNETRLAQHTRSYKSFVEIHQPSKALLPQSSEKEQKIPWQCRMPYQ
eukprot:3581420-Karenia_brevis.AAC.1